MKINEKGLNLDFQSTITIFLVILFIMLLKIPLVFCYYCWIPLALCKAFKEWKPRVYTSFNFCMMYTVIWLKPRKRYTSSPMEGCFMPFSTLSKCKTCYSDFYYYITVMDQIVFPSSSYVEHLTYSFSQCDCIWTEGL